MPAGRPKNSGSKYTPELAEKVCELVASGDSRREAARKIGVSEGAIRQWQRDHTEFDTQYARAVIDRADVFYERGNDIAMSITSPEEAQIARVQLDWLKWSASKLAPKQYGDKQQVEHSGELGIAIASRIASARSRTGSK
jgi:hypothetical protein